jgi:hypothetical protein
MLKITAWRREWAHELKFMEERCLFLYRFPISFFLTSQSWKFNKDGNKLGKRMTGGAFGGGERRTGGRKRKSK